MVEPGLYRNCFLYIQQEIQRSEILCKAVANGHISGEDVQVHPCLDAIVGRSIISTIQEHTSSRLPHNGSEVVAIAQNFLVDDESGSVIG